MSTSNMLWNMVKALYFFGCMTVACAQLSAAGSLAAAGGLSATNIPIGDELLETNTGGRLRHGHRLIGQVADQDSTPTRQEVTNNY